jgi:hypothetical protein
MRLEGWGGYVLKEKFKLIKIALREWHASHLRNLNVKIANLKDRQAELDGKGELEELSAEDCEEI